MEEEGKRSLESFIRWASELGVSDAPLNPQHPSSSSFTGCLGRSLLVDYFPDAGGRGLTANRTLRRGELALTVPIAALMTSESILQKDAELAHVVKRHPPLSSTQVLTVLLLAEISKGRKSFWYPYLMQIPRSYYTFATFGPFELKALQIDEAIWTAEKAMSKAESDWKEASALIAELKLKPQLVTFKAWLWASATISSRTLHIPWDTAGCLCPVGDFFNYAAPGHDSSEEESSDKACSMGVGSFEDRDSTGVFTSETDQCDGLSGRLTDGGYDESVAAYCFYARKDYQKREQVLLSYGTYTNLELLEHYGFLLNDNPNDKVFIPLTHEILAADKSWPGDSMYIQYDGKPSFALLSALRYWATPTIKRRSVRHLTTSGCQLSPENETSVMRWIASTCNAILQDLPTKIEDDRMLLQAIDLFLDDPNHVQVKELPCVVAGQWYDFLASVGLPGSETGNREAFPGKNAVRTLEKWRLAIKWRVGYKKVLIDAVSHCALTIEFLSRNNR